MYYAPNFETRFSNHSEIRSAFPNTSLPVSLTDETLAEIGVYPLFTDKPAYNPITQGIVDRGVVGAPPEFSVDWEIIDLTPEQVAANQAAKDQAILNECVTNTQKRLDDFAKERHYDGILSLCTYATSSVPKFKAEGQCGVDSRDQTWAKLYDMLAEVEAGTRPKPSGYSDIESELPVLEWSV